MNFLVKIGKILSGDTKSPSPIPFKRSKNQKVDYVDPKSVRGLRLKNAIFHFFDHMLGGTPLRNNPIKRYVYVQLDIGESLSDGIKTAYSDAQDPEENHSLRLEDAQNFLKKVLKKVYFIDDEEGLKKIIKNRQMIKEMNHILYEMGDIATGVKMIQKYIRSLAEVSSQHIIKLKEEAKTFCIPGGSFKNPVCYEFKRNSEGKYLFVIHNRLARYPNNDVLLGSQAIKFELGNRDYGKTSLCIQFEDVSQLSNSDFLTSLFKAEKLGNTVGAYQVIKECLLSGRNKGQILQSAEEKEVQECQHKIKKFEKEQQKDEKASKELVLLKRRMRALKKNLIKKDPSFNSFAAFYSAESNFSPAEQEMASVLTRQRLRHYTIQIIVDQIVAKEFLNRQAQDAAEIIQRHQKEAP